MPIVKQGRFESKTYRQWVMQQPCAFCNAAPYSDPHHYPTRGSSGTVLDFNLCPACRRCHMRCAGIRVDGMPPISREDQVRAVQETIYRFVRTASASEWGSFAEDRAHWWASRAFANGGSP